MQGTRNISCPWDGYVESHYSSTSNISNNHHLIGFYPPPNTSNVYSEGALWPKFTMPRLGDQRFSQKTVAPDAFPRPCKHLCVRDVFAQAKWYWCLNLLGAKVFLSCTLYYQPNSLCDTDCARKQGTGVSRESAAHMPMRTPNRVSCRKLGNNALVMG